MLKHIVICLILGSGVYTSAVCAEKVAELPAESLLPGAEMDSFIPGKVRFRETKESKGQDLWVTRKYEKIGEDGVKMVRVETDIMLPAEIARNRPFQVVCYTLRHGIEKYDVFPGINVVIKYPDPSEKLEEYQEMALDLRQQFAGELSAEKLNLPPKIESSTTTVENKTITIVKVIANPAYLEALLPTATKIAERLRIEAEKKNPKMKKAIRKAFSPEVIRATIPTSSEYWYESRGDERMLVRSVQYNALGEVLSAEDFSATDNDFAVGEGFFDLPKSSKLLIATDFAERKALFRKHIRMAYTESSKKKP